jgi:hypothetical protein
MNITIKQIATISQSVVDEFLSRSKRLRASTSIDTEILVLTHYHTEAISKLEGLQLLPCIEIFSKSYYIIQDAKIAINTAFLVELDSFSNIPPASEFLGTGESKATLIDSLVGGSK